MQPNINQAAEALPSHHLTPVAGGKQDETIASLTGLRIYAALAVFFSHMYHFQYFGLPPVWVLLISSLGHLGVSLFYVLSGFVLCLRYHQGFQDKADIRAFYSARFARVYPVFLLTALLALPIEWFSAFRSQLPMTLGTQATLTHCLLPQTCGRLNDVGWSVGIEASFYVLFPALLLLVSNAKRLIAGVLLLGLSLWGLQLLGVDSFYGSARFFLNRVPEFLMGILAGGLYVRQVQPPLLKKMMGNGKALTVMTVSLACALFLMPLLTKALGVENYYYLLLMIPSTGLIYLLASAERQKNTLPWLTSGLVVLGGEISYSFYLVHNLLLRYIRHGFGVMAHLKTEQMPVWIQIALAGATLLISLLISYFLYQQVETVWRKKIRAWLG